MAGRERVAHSHDDTTNPYVWTKPLSYSRAFPENAHKSKYPQVQLSKHCLLFQGTQDAAQITYPSLFLSINAGMIWCTYAHVQIRRRMTRSRD
jgi:hypothetical protein